MKKAVQNFHYFFRKHYCILKFSHSLQNLKDSSHESKKVNFQETIDTWNRALLNISCHIFLCYVHIQLLPWTILMAICLSFGEPVWFERSTLNTARPGYSYTVPCMTNDVFCYINTIQVDSALHTCKLIDMLKGDNINQSQGKLSHKN